MPKPESSIGPGERTEFQIRTHIAEFEKLRDEILQSESVGQQTLVLTLASASVILPILVGQFRNLSESTFASMLYALTIIYSVFAIRYANAEFHEAALGKYINEYLAPRLNRLLGIESGSELLHWETFIRLQREKISSAFLETAAASTTLLVMLLPGAASLLMMGFISRTPGNEFIHATITIPPFWIIALEVISWLCFGASLLAVLFATAYNITIAHIIFSKSPNGKLPPKIQG